MYMKNVTYKILMGCYIVAALVLVTACNDGLDIQSGKPSKSAASWCGAVATSRPPTRYVISSRTARAGWRWTTARCSSPTTCTRWRKRPSGFTTPRHQPTNRRLTFISSTASGRCSNYLFHLIMTTVKARNKSNSKSLKR